MCEKVMEIFEDSESQQNKYENIKRDVENIELTEEERVLYEQLINAEQDFENITDLLNRNRDGFTTHVAKYNDILQRLRNLKNADEELDTILNETEENNLLTTTYKQLDNVIRPDSLKNLDKTKPWKQDNNIVLLPL
jgi:predicted methyltransferase MtxX (methanogen marker protein 4)